MRATMERFAQDFTTRQQSGEISFAESVAQIAGVDQSEGLRLLDIYRSNKIVKFDASSGRYTVKHGAYLDKSQIIHILANN